MPKHLTVWFSTLVLLTGGSALAYEVGITDSQTVSYENCKEGENLKCFTLHLLIEQDRGGLTGKVRAGMDRVNIHTDAYCQGKTQSGSSFYGVPEFTLDMSSGATTLEKFATLPAGCVLKFHAREQMNWPSKDKIHTFTLDATEIESDLCMVFNTWTGHTWTC